MRQFSLSRRRAKLPAERNGDGVEFLSDKCLHQLFEKQAANTPGAVALVLENDSLTYAQLNCRANQLAHYLIDLGVKPELLVAICVEPTLEMIVAMLAVLKAGGAYVPLDPAFPPDRLRFMLQDSGAFALITQRHLSALFSEFETSLPVLEIDAANPPWGSNPGANPDAQSIGLNSSHLAQILYTSGSTGRPKGVLIEHRGLTVQALWFMKEFRITSEYAGIVGTSLSFLTVYKNIFGTLFAGGQLHLVRNQRDPNALISVAFRANVTLLNLTPTTFSMLLEADSRNELSKVKTVLPTGEPLRLHLFAKLPDPRPEFVNTYGQTECGTASIHRLRPGFDGSEYEIAPIGRPLPYARIYILNEQRQPVPPGAEGELYIGGAGLARGYLNRPDLTAERFLQDPFVSESRARMFRSGDLGRWLPDGTIEFLGRSDSRIKIRGIRIEPGEIEVRLMEHPFVRDAVVIAREDFPRDEKLVAYYLPSRIGVGSQDPPHPAQLRSHLAASLPEQVLPAAYVSLPTWPKTSSGKLDRSALPPPTMDSYPHCGDDPPQGYIETKLAEIWAEVLSLQRVGRNDSFFTLGGHSLSAMRVAARLRNDLQLEIPIETLFQNPSLQSFAKTVEVLCASRHNEGELMGILDEIEAAPAAATKGKT